MTLPEPSETTACPPTRTASRTRSLLACALAFFFLAAMTSPASLLILTNLTSLNLPDTNIIKVVQADTNLPTADGGHVTTVGLPVRVTPDSNGVVQIFRTTGNYLLYGPPYGAGIIYRFPDSSSNATAIKLSGFNTFETPTIIIPGTNVFWNTATNLAGARPATILWVFPTNNSAAYSLLFTN
jgi:hypothetical protein